ncbi:hypothetical protein JCM14469_21360 [Desulfatiferula olefinivorans]
MKTLCALTVFAVLFAAPARAGDYMVELFEEHYKEKMIPGPGDMKVNHTWQVKTRFGSKVLILVGTDYNLRTWIRQYAGNHKLWIVKIPDEGDERFVYNLSVYVDLQQLQPVYGKKWTCEGCRLGSPPRKPPPPPVEPQ